MSKQGTEPFAALERDLNQWLARTEEPPSEPAPCPSEPDLARKFEECLQQLQSYLNKSEGDAEQALAPLSAAMQDLRQWLDALSMARAKLAERTARTV